MSITKSIKNLLGIKESAYSEKITEILEASLTKKPLKKAVKKVAKKAPAKKTTVKKVAKKAPAKKPTRKK